MKYKAASSIIASHTRLFVGEQEGIIVDWLCAITHALLQSQNCIVVVWSLGIKCYLSGSI